MKYKAIIFDVDGTLLDTEKSVITSLKETLLEVEGRTYAYEDLFFALGIPGKKAMEILEIQNTDTFMKHWLKLDHDYEYMNAVFPGIQEVLKALKEQGVRLGVVTSRERSECDRFLELYDLGDYFEVASCAGEAAHSKPAPDPLLNVLEQLNVAPSEALYVGDAVYDMLCADSAGADGALGLWGACQPDKISATYKLESPLDILDL